MPEMIILALMGLCLVIIGVVNMTGNVRSIHSYNRRKVAEQDIPKYGKLVGIGTALIGLAMMADALLLLLEQATVVPFVLIPALLIGLALILYAQFKYNKGLF